MGSFADTLKHAFSTGQAVDDDDQRLAPALKTLAQSVVDRQMETPAIVLLETIRPLNFLMHQTMLFVLPFVQLFGNMDGYRDIAEALEDRRTLELLIERIETLAHKRTGA